MSKDYADLAGARLVQLDRSRHVIAEHVLAPFELRADGSGSSRFCPHLRLHADAAWFEVLSASGQVLHSQAA